MLESLRQAVTTALGEGLGKVRSLAGGDVADAFLVTSSSGRRVFVKSRVGAPPGMFAAEARGLTWLGDAGALRVPEVIAVGELEPGFLALEYLEPGSPRGDFDEALGRGLASLHQTPAAAFGLDHDNFIGPLPQRNAARASWVEFFIEQRLEPQLALALASGAGRPGWSARFSALCRRLPGWVPEEPPQRLHGDLWGGNLHVGPAGEPCLIDPAAYAGHREVDLAMMRLFGGFAPRVFEAYREAFPLLPGASERVPLYQLYPLLVHVNLFGGSYVGSVERALAQLP